MTIFGKGAVMLCRHQCDHLWEGYSDVVQTSVWPSLGRFGKGTVMLCRHQCDHLWEGYSDVVQTSVWPSLGRVQ